MKININPEKLSFTTIVELIELFSKLNNRDLPTKTHKDIGKIVAFSGSTFSQDDIDFIEKTLKKTRKKIENYFEKKPVKKLSDY